MKTWKAELGSGGFDAVKAFHRQAIHIGQSDSQGGEYMLMTFGCNSNITIHGVTIEELRGLRAVLDAVILDAGVPSVVSNDQTQKPDHEQGA